MDDAGNDVNADDAAAASNYYYSKHTYVTIAK